MPAINYMDLATLVTASDVANATMTGGNFDTLLIKTDVIQIAEIAHIRSRIGEDFYDFIKVNMDAAAGDRCWDDGEVGPPVVPNSCTSCDMGSGTNNGYEVWVNDYLKPALCWYVKFEVLNDMQYNSSSAGIQTNIPEYSEPVDPKILNAYKQDVYRKAEVLMNSAISFLKDDDNDGCFPEYENQTTGDGYNCDDTCNDNGLVTKNHGMIMY
jgi:hypothetical protein